MKRDKLLSDLPKQLLDVKLKLKEAKKGLREDYDDERQRIKEIEKSIKPFWNSQKIPTESDLAKVVSRFTHELLTLHERHYIHSGIFLRSVAELNKLAINSRGIVILLNEISKEKGLKRTRTKLRKIEQTQNSLLDFNNQILSSVKQRQEQRKQIAQEKIKLKGELPYK
jgi:hypothetical protein